MMADEKKPDVVLADGRAITFDLNKMTVKEWRTFIDQITVEAEDELVERCAGVEPGTIGGLGYEDWRAFTKAFYHRIREAADPN
jgi:hypothetical protein